MQKNRLEAFSDGVFAIIITIMVLEIKAPAGGEMSDLMKLWPVFLSYIMSFVFLAIYWNNHHHMIHATNRVSGGVLWANTHLLFWLSLVPVMTAWMGEHHFTPLTVGVYGAVLLLSVVAYKVLQENIIKQEGRDSAFARTLGKDVKGKLSLISYAIAIVLSPFSSATSLAIYLVVAAMWFVPDRRMERILPGAE
ncbi:MAG: DUF1211 domain-containing protein [Chthonomonas sp.]|nr:DUF1211 domain-containing protein [Chthonomonas sp.]